MVERIKTLTIMILDDEEDILTLYNDYLSRKGHRIIKTYVNSETILDDIEIERPDAYIIDYRLPGNRNGIEVASEILKKFPSSCIMFITAFEFLDHEISKHDIFYDKNIEILIKPVKLRQIEDSLLNLTSNQTT
jgi:DNA-binding NtrC family response regulator